MISVDKLRMVSEITSDGMQLGPSPDLKGFLQDSTSAEYAGRRVYAELGALGALDLDPRLFVGGASPEIAGSFMAGVAAEMEARSE